MGTSGRKIHLEKIDRLLSNGNAYSFDEILELFRSVVKSEALLREVIARYGSSESPEILSAVSFILAQIAKENNLRDLSSIIMFIDGIPQNVENDVLMNIIASMYEQLLNQNYSKPSSVSSDKIFSFVTKCLNFSGKHSLLVKTAIVDLLTFTCEANHLSQLFNSNDVEKIIFNLKNSDFSSDDNLERQISDLVLCLETEKYNKT